MNVLAQTLWLDIAHRVGWTLIHSLWQLAAVAVLVMIALRLLQRAKPQTRYVVAVATYSDGARVLLRRHCRRRLWIEP